MGPEQQYNKSQSDIDQTEKFEMYTPEPDDTPEDNVSNAQNDKRQLTDYEPVHWSSSEYIHGEKNIGWFVVFTISVIGLIFFDLFVLKSYSFSVLVIVMAAALIIYSRRSPKLVDYTLSIDQGLYIGEKLYHFSDFKSFGLIKDDDNHSLMLIPIKRFDPGVSVYFPEEVGEKLVDILGARLPMENLKLDIIDVIVRKLRL